MYTQQDPIGLFGKNPTIYGYVYDTNAYIDIFELRQQISFTDSKGLTLSKPVVIQEHSLGHTKATPGHELKLHFKVRPPSNRLIWWYSWSLQFWRLIKWIY